VRAVVDAWRHRRPPIVRPAVGEQHGHPVLFDRSVFDELRHAPLAGGAKTVVHAHEDALLNVQVDDEGCVTDIDTPAEYDALLQRSKES
jgi:molybdenum cofactor cytidylyltransferase